MEVVSIIFWTFVGFEYLVYRHQQKCKIEGLVDMLTKTDASVEILDRALNAKIHRISLRQNEICPAYYTVW